MSPSKVVLLACGSFNPPTNMHLRMFEIARDHLHRMGSHLVIGGLMSPVHDAYAKNDLESATHRKEMVRLALKNSGWIKLSDWECNQESWSRTRQVLNYHQNHVNDILQASMNDNNSNMDEESNNWFPDNVRNGCYPDSVGVKLLCGADLLESFGTPGLWADEDIESIVGKYGLVVITRNNTNPLEFIYNSDLLTKYMSNITIVTEWIGNEVSSTKIRRALRRNESVKYLIPDAVIDYIQLKGLYGCQQNKYTPNIIYNLNSEESPVDVIMTPTSLTNCLNMCNNNLFGKFESFNNRLVIDTVDSKKKTAVALVNHKHPGQAVKIQTEKLVTDTKKAKEKVGGTSDSDKKSGTKLPLRSTRSSNDFFALDKEKKSTTYKSDDSLKDCKSCDENLIKFIFNKHGIQIISDVETIV